MKPNEFNISLTYNQILELVRQLSPEHKAKLYQELEKEVLDAKLAELFAVFRTDELSQEDIDEAVEQVRAERFTKNAQA